MNPKDIVVRSFETHEWQQYRDTRLCALNDSPDAFASTYETTSLISDSEWKNRLQRISSDSDLPLAALVNAEFAGMAWVRFSNPDDHAAYLYQMWVSTNYRGCGIARKLLHTALQWASSLGADSMRLGVTCGDTSARRLYESVGFIPVGKREPLRPASDLMVQNMELVFSDERI